MGKFNRWTVRFSKIKNMLRTTIALRLSKYNMLCRTKIFYIFVRKRYIFDWLKSSRPIGSGQQNKNKNAKENKFNLIID
jgi:hypothetical protein